MFTWLGRNFSMLMYVLIWLTGSIFAGLSFFYGGLDLEFTNEAFGRSTSGARIAVVAFFVATIFHQGMIYISLHGLEDQNHRWQPASPLWIGSSGEVAIRVVAFFTLLIIGQKISIQYLHENGYIPYLTGLFNAL